MALLEEHHHHFILYIIPRLVFALSGLFLIVILAYIGNQSLHLSSSALTPIVPREVMVTNLSGKEGTISWFTRLPTKGYVIIHDASGKTLPAFLDDRVHNPNEGKFLTHYVSVNGLSPSTLYYFTIYSDGKKFVKDENGKVFSFKTLPLDPSPPPPPQNIFGRVIDVEGKPAGDVILYAYPTSGTPISTITDKNGSYVLNLLSSRDYSTGSVITTLGQKIKINVVKGDEARSSMFVDLNEEGFIPTIQLGRDYDFSVNYPPEGAKVKAKDLEISGRGRSGQKIQIKVE